MLYDSAYYNDSALCSVIVDDVAKMKLKEPGNPTGASYLKVYPNPNNGNFAINLNMGDSSNSIITVDIRNIMGSLIYSGIVALSSGTYTGSMDLSNYSSGMYFISAYEGQRDLHSSFIINH